MYVDSVVFYSWLAGWNNVQSMVFNYDTTGNITEFIKYYWDPGRIRSNKWHETFRYSVTYDSLGNKTKSAMKSLYLNNYTVYTYDSTGNIAEETLYYEHHPTLGASQWVKGSQTVYTYDANGNLIEETYYHENITILGTSKWVKASHTVYKYDANGNQNDRIHYNWDKISDTYFDFFQSCHDVFP